MNNNNNNNKLLLVENYLKQLIREQLNRRRPANKQEINLVQNTLKFAKQFRNIPNSNLIVLRDSLLVLIKKLQDTVYGEPQKRNLIKAINQIFAGDKESAIQSKWTDISEVQNYVSTNFPNGNPVGNIIQDYAGYKYLIWKYNKPSVTMVCQDLDTNKVYWVDTDELLKGFDKL